MKQNVALGVDIGGSHITAGLVDLENKCIVPASIKRKHIDSSGTTANIIRSWAEVMQGVLSLSSNVGHIGIAMPGPFDYENGISFIKGQGKYEQLYGEPIKLLLANRLNIDSANLHFVNDAASFLKGELFAGSLENYSNGIGITLGTGLGTALMQNGKVADANLWSMPFKDGIAEDYISTRWFVKRYKALFGHNIEGVKELLADEIQSVVAEVLFGEFSENLACFMYEFVKLQQPEAIVLGGNISYAHPHFLNKATAKLNELLGKEIPLTISLLGEKAALMGAASSKII